MKCLIDTQQIIELLPGHIYWKDVEGHILGCNTEQAHDLGFELPEEVIGKTDYDITTKENADAIRAIDIRVMQNGIGEVEEESFVRKNGTTMFFLSKKDPLRDSKGNIIGVLGISIDITDRKKAEMRAERLKLESELQRTKLQEQEKFSTVAEQVAHDIRSPLASLSMIVGACKNLPESERITLREVATGIGDIANNLLCRYKKGGDEVDGATTKAPQHILVSLALAEILSSKKYQYKLSLVKFHCSIESDSNFLFIETNLSDFCRTISNLINNAVEALEWKEGIVELKLGLDGEQVKVTVQDNGKGIPQEIIDKVMNNISVTSGKKNGCGIGLAQVRGTLHACNGKMEIESKLGEGTKIILTFPRVETAEWVADEIELHKGDTVIVLDDDSSIHGAWKARFEPYISDIKLQHFRLWKEAVEFIGNLTAQERERVLFLSDFELINQELNGLQVIEQTAMQPHSLLVTSHHNNQNTRNLAAKIVVKILPKQLVSDVAIKIKEEKDDKGTADDNCKKVDLVVIDDVQMFADSMTNFFRSKDLEVDTYYSPKRFLENLSQYAKNTKICMDNDFGGQITGFELAKQLNEAGYTQLYMLSGKTFEKGQVPSYLTMLLKGDMSDLDKLA